MLGFDVVLSHSISWVWYIKSKLEVSAANKVIYFFDALYFRYRGYLSKPGIQLLIFGFFIFRSRPEKIRGSNLKFTSYFNFSFNLFLSNFWMLVFSFLQTRVLNFFFSVNCCSMAQQSRTRVFKFGFQNPGFEFPVSHPTWYFIFQVPKFQTQKKPFSGLL